MNPKFDISVLIVDDDSVTRFIHKKLIQHIKSDIFFYEAGNGQEAFELLCSLKMQHKSIPDIILLDLDMPLLNGFGFIEMFQKYYHEGDAKIVMVSSSINQQDINRCKGLRVDYVSKPLTMIILEEVISEMCIKLTPPYTV